MAWRGPASSGAEGRLTGLAEALTARRVALWLSAASNADRADTPLSACHQTRAKRRTRPNMHGPAVSRGAEEIRRCSPVSSWSSSTSATCSAFL